MPSSNRAPCPPRQVAQLRAGWAAGAPPLPRSAAAPRAAALGLSILPAAPHSVGFGWPRPERRGRRCCSRGAGQRRRARRVPPAGRKGASAPPGPAARDPGPKRRRRPGCPGPVPDRRGPWPAVPGPGYPRRSSWRAPPELPVAPWGCPQSPGLTCAGRRAPRCGGVCAARAPPPAASGAGAGPPAALGLTGPPAAPGSAARAPRRPRCGMLPASAAARAPPATPAPAFWAMPHCLHAGEAPGRSEPLRTPAPRR